MITKATRAEIIHVHVALATPVVIPMPIAAVLHVTKDMVVESVPQKGNNSIS